MWPRTVGLIVLLIAWLGAFNGASAYDTRRLNFTTVGSAIVGIPSNITVISYRIQGGGGGGGGGTGASAGATSVGGSGGGSGFYTQGTAFIPAGVCSDMTIVVGAGGAGGAGCAGLCTTLAGYGLGGGDSLVTLNCGTRSWTVRSKSGGGGYGGFSGSKGGGGGGSSSGGAPDVAGQGDPASMVPALVGSTFRVPHYAGSKGGMGGTSSLTCSITAGDASQGGMNSLTLGGRLGTRDTSDNRGCAGGGGAGSALWDGAAGGIGRVSNGNGGAGSNAVLGAGGGGGGAASLSGTGGAGGTGGNGNVWIEMYAETTL